MKLPRIYDGDLLATRNFTPSFIVPPFIRAGSLTLISAEPFVGKSALLMGAACATRYSTPFMGNQVQKGRVLYLACDAPRWDYQTLLCKVRGGLGVEADPPRDGSHPSLAFCFTRFDIMESIAGAGAVTGLLDAMLDSLRDVRFNDDESALGARPDVVIIDTLRNIHRLDENEAGAMSVIMDKLRSVADAGTAVVLAHHTAKNGALSGGYSARGSTVIPGSADIHIILKRVPTPARPIVDPLPPGGGESRVKAIWVKGRGGDCPENLTYTMSWDKTNLTFSLPAMKGGKKSFTPEVGVPYSWNALAAHFGASGDQLHQILAATGWVKGPDKMWRMK